MNRTGESNVGSLFSSEFYSGSHAESAGVRGMSADGFPLGAFATVSGVRACGVL
jgi:hypothetical protein